MKLNMGLGKIGMLAAGLLVLAACSSKPEVAKPKVGTDVVEGLLPGGDVKTLDNTDVDTDLVTSGLQVNIDFGNICKSSTSTARIATIYARTSGRGGGTPHVGPNIWQNSAVLTVTSAITGTGASSFNANTNVGTINLPATWQNLGNNNLSNPVASSITFTAGTTTGLVTATITYTASGNRSTSGTLNIQQTINVNATVVNCNNAPTINIQSQTVEGNTIGGWNFASFSLIGTASDTEDAPASPSVVCTPAVGSVLPVGANSVSCTATDSGGLTATASGTITVTDTTPPVISGTPGNQTVEATGPGGAVATYANPTASDIVDGVRPVSCAPASGSTFALGSTTVTCSSSDTHGNSSSSSFTVTVQDTTPPVLSLPANITAEATGPSGATVSFSATATDIVDGSITPTCAPASGSTFAIATTTVNCSATDAAGNTASGSFTVKVQDTTPPVISGTPANQILEATGPSGAVATWASPTASDIVDGNVAVNCSPASGSTFPIATTTVTCTATDAHSNSSSTSFTVKVQDTTPPAITWVGSITNGASYYFGSVPAAPTCTATDLVSGSVPCSVSGYSTAIGSHTLTATATDGAGNTATQTRSYTVLAWTLNGFYQPVDMGGVYNTVKGGSTVPFKFEVFAGSTELTSTSVIKSFTTTPTACPSGPSVNEDEIEIITTGGTSLRYDTVAGQFIQNWQTPKSPGACYKVTMTTQDGSSLVAFFKLK